METPTIYNKVAYQTIDLTRNPLLASPFTYVYTINEGISSGYKEIDTFINKNYNLIEGFFFDYPEEIEMCNVLVEEFKIDDLEVLPIRFPVDLFKTGKSTPFQEKFIPLNIPIRQGKLKIRLRAISLNPATFNKINLVFKLKNVKDESVFYQDYFKYQVEKIALESTAAADIFKFNFRPNYGVEKLVGITTKTLSFVPTNPAKLNQLGMLKLSINSKKSNPINISIFEHTTPNIKYKQTFLTLNESIEKSSIINGVFELHNSTTIPSIVLSTACDVILKYKI